MANETYSNETFIEYIRVHPYLFDASNCRYKDTAFKDTVWAAIGARFAISVDKAKLKWKCLRDRYVRVKKDFKAQSASEFGAPRYPKWALYPILDNLLASTIENRNSADSQSSPPVEEIEVVHEEYNVPSPESVSIEEDTWSSADRAESCSVVDFCGPVLKRKRPASPDVLTQVLEQLESRFSTANEALQSLKSTMASKTPVDLWLDSLAPLIKTLPQKKFSLFRFEVEKLLYNVQCESD